MQKIKDLAAKHKISVALVGGSLVIGSTFGQCVLEPASDEAAAPVEQAPAQDGAAEVEAQEGQAEQPAQEGSP